MTTDRPSPRGNWADISLPWGVVFLLAASTLVTGVYSFRTSDPPRFLPEWYASWGLGILSMLVFLSVARRTTGWFAPVVVAACMLTSLLAVILPTLAYFDSFHDFLLPHLIAYVAAFVVGSWFCRLRLLAVGTVATAVTYGYALLWMPPAIPAIPTAQHQAGISLTVLALQREGPASVIEIVVAGDADVDIAKQVDVGSVQASGSAGGVMPFRCLPARLMLPLQDQKRNEARLQLISYPPECARSVTYKIGLLHYQPGTRVYDSAIRISADALPPPRLIEFEFDGLPAAR